MKRFLAICLMFGFLFGAVSCSPTSTTTQITPTSPKGNEFEVVFVYNNEQCSANRIYFDTNFPVGTLFNFELKKGADFSIEQSGVAVQVAGASSLNFLQTDAFVIEDEVVPDDNYILFVEMVDITEQPENVQALLGKDGKKMIGQNVHAITTVAGGTTAYEKEGFSTSYKVTKNGDKYSFFEQ